MKTILALSVFSLVVALTPHLMLAQTSDPSSEAVKLMQLSRAWSDSVAAGNLDAAIDFWADDAVMMAPDQPPIRGKDAIREYIMASADIPGFAIRWEPIEAHVSASEDLAYLIERNQISMLDENGNTVTQHNKVVTVWRRQSDGSWKNVIDMWNADPTGGE